MSDANLDSTRGQVLLVEPNAALRSAVLTLLAAECFEAEAVDSLDAALSRAVSSDRTVALVAWQSMHGLLSEEHRHHLAELSRRLRLVVMVPRRWARLLDATDLRSCVTGLIAKPFQADELIDTLQQALAQTVEPNALTS
jgi:FixJ family two-component response regulator